MYKYNLNFSSQLLKIQYTIASFIYQSAINLLYKNASLDEAEGVNPSGRGKPRRGAVFSLITEVFGQVKDDADAAFWARFPRLADERKPERHGRAALVPRLLRDSGTSTEAFLHLSLKILDLSDADRAWVLAFLDSTFDPNSELIVAEWFHFIETMLMDEALGIRADRTGIDVCSPKDGFCYDRRFLCDQRRETLRDGTWDCDGSRLRDRFMPARGTVFDTIGVSNGAYRCDGSIDASGSVKVYAPIAIPDVVLLVDTEGDRLSIRLSMAPMEDHGIIRPVCDGGYTGFDGRYCREEVIEEAVCAACFSADILVGNLFSL